MLRKTLTILSLIGLLLSVGLWGVSYWHVQAYFIRTGEGVTINLMRGCLLFRHFVYVGGPRLSKNELLVGGFNGFDTMWILPYFSTRVGPPAARHVIVYVPLHLLALVFLVLSGYLLAPTYRRRKRMKLGLCVKCGYDLRASKDRCPECGEEFETT